MTEKSVSKQVEELQERLRWYEESPLESSYTACKNTIEKFNAQLSEKEVDIFDIETKPIFEMAHKYLTEMDGYLATLEKIRSRMNPELAKSIDKKITTARDVRKEALA